MGSPYLLAHGLGTPVADASTTFNLESSGVYHVWVRTKDWVARWQAPGTPGRFKLSFNDQILPTDFGTEGAEWSWQYGGTVQAVEGANAIRLIDATGFDGRCDCIALTPQKTAPPNGSGVLPPWRRKILNISESPVSHGPYDLVVTGGGYAGISAAISAARMGLTVALIQNRPVLGGNGSSEVRVWAKGLIRRGSTLALVRLLKNSKTTQKKAQGHTKNLVTPKKKLSFGLKIRLTCF